MKRTISKRLRLSSPLKIEEEAKFIEKQGIVSILGSDSEQTKAASLRRTLSADMSSKKWLAQNGFSPMKMIASSEELAISVSDSASSLEGEEEYEGNNEFERPGEADVWRPIQPQKMELEKPGQFDIWSTILSQKANDESSKLPPPYVHPLVKSSASSLSEKSLEMCTESLGSETGSDGFSSDAPSETGDVEENEEELQPQPQSQLESQSQSLNTEELRFVKYNYSAASKRLPPRSFPPPVHCLARCDGPASLHMHSHRNNGRLVLEAVSVPSQNYFHAQRQHGHLVLTFANGPLNEGNHEEILIDHKKDEVGEVEELFETFEDEKDNETEEEEESQEEEEEEMEKVENGQGAKEVGIFMEQAPKLSSVVINVHGPTLLMKKLMGLDNRKPTWNKKFNKAVNLVELEVEVELEEKEGPTPLSQTSLPRPPRLARLLPLPPATAAAAASSFNAYHEYLWGTKPTLTNVINPITQQCPPVKNKCSMAILSNSPKANEHQEMVLFRGNKADYLVPLLRGCKEHRRRSLLLWEPCSIATS